MVGNDMEHLSKHIAEAVSRGKRQRGRFPERNDDAMKIIDFLEENGFEYLNNRGELISTANGWNKDMFDHGGFNSSPSTHWIEFYRHGDDSNFFFVVDVPDDYIDRSDISNFRRWIVKNGRVTDIEDYKTYKEFRDEVITHYGW